MGEACGSWYIRSMELPGCQTNFSECAKRLQNCENPGTNVTDRRAGSFLNPVLNASGLPAVNKELTIRCFVLYALLFSFAGACVGFQLYREWATFAHDIGKRRWFLGKLMACLLSILSGQQRKERLELGRHFSVEDKARSEQLISLYRDATHVDVKTKQWIISRRILRYQILFDLCGLVCLSNVLWSIQVSFFIDLDSIWNDIVVLGLIGLHMYLCVQGLLRVILCDRQFVAMMPTKLQYSREFYHFITVPMLMFCLALHEIDVWIAGELCLMGLIESEKRQA